MFKTKNTKGKEKLLYIPNVKTTIKNGTIVFGTAVILGGFISILNHAVNVIMALI